MFGLFSAVHVTAGHNALRGSGPGQFHTGTAIEPQEQLRRPVLSRAAQIETEAAPIRYVAELVGNNVDSECAIRWLIVLMVLCCDPLTIALTAAASARRSTTT